MRYIIYWIFQIEETFSSDRLAAAAMAKSEAAALQVRVEGLQSEVCYVMVIHKDPNSDMYYLLK